MSDPHSVETFVPAVGRAFSLEGEGTPALTLMEARPLGERGGAPRRPFALLFDGPSHLPLQQGTYALHEASVGSFAIFLVPVGLDGDRLLYEAIFG